MRLFIMTFIFQTEYNERAARREAGEIETDEYEMYLDIATRDNKGRVFGMGSVAPTLFRPPQTKSKTSGSSGYAPGTVAQYATQQKELQKELDEVKKQQEWFKEQMKLQFGWTYPDPNCNQGPQPHRREPFDDDSSGASMGNQVIPPV